MERYSRQIAIPEIGEQGQKKLENSSALVIGAGGLGSSLLYCLAAAGVGKIGIADGDVVSESNLNRQFLHSTADIGREKVLSAREKLLALNPNVRYNIYNTYLNGNNAEEIISGYDIVLPAVDSISARLLVNRLCWEKGTPLVNGGVSGLYGTLQVVIPQKTPCLECLYSDRPAPSAGSPSLGAVVSVISSLMADAAIALLLGLPNPSEDCILYFDGATLTFQRVPLAKSPNCPICGKKESLPIV